MIEIIYTITIVMMLIFAQHQFRRKPKEEIKKPLMKYEIPHTFWQDYNKCLFAIRDMNINNYEIVESKIDDFTYKYVELIEYVVFVEKISNLVSLYNNQVKSFLINKHLN